MKITLHTRMQDFGQMVDGITIELDQIAPALQPEDFRCTDCFYDIGASKPISGVKSVKAEGNCKRAGRMRTRAERTCKKLFFPANRIIKPFFG